MKNFYSIKLALAVVFALLANMAVGKSLSVTSNGQMVSNNDVIEIPCVFEDYSVPEYGMYYYQYKWDPYLEVANVDGSTDLTVTVTSIDNSAGFQFCWPMECRQVNAGQTVTVHGKIDSEPSNLQLHKEYSTESKDEIPTEQGSVIVNLKTSSEEIEFTVKCLPVEKLSIIPESAELKIGENLTLRVEGYEEDSLLKTLTWTSSDESIAKVDSEGRVSGVGVGNAIITASPLSGFPGSCNITVKPILVESIELSPTTWKGVEGDSFKISAFVLPENATDKSIVWVSNDESIATVDNEGNVQTLSSGEVDIFAISADVSEVKAVCHLSVDKLIVQVNGITIDTSSAKLGVGECLSLFATVYPENATDKTVVWSSDNTSVANVDDNGIVTALTTGIANITAECAGYIANCEITVETIPVESILLTPDNWIGIEGRSFKIEALIIPENATDKSLDWSSSHETIATVDEDGYVTVLKDGNCVITATASDGSNVFAECIIISVAGVEGIFFEEESITIYSINGTLYQKNVDIKELNQLKSGIYIIRQGANLKKIIIP